MSIIRENLMNSPGYSPYCGSDKCHFTWPRTVFDGNQFKCKCGWRSQFPDEFIIQYKIKWNIKEKEETKDIQVSDEMYQYLQKKAKELKEGKLNLIGPLSAEDLDKLILPEIPNQKNSEK